MAWFRGDFSTSIRPKCLNRKDRPDQQRLALGALVNHQLPFAADAEVPVAFVTP